MDTTDLIFQSACRCPCEPVVVSIQPQPQPFQAAIKDSLQIVKPLSHYQQCPACLTKWPSNKGKKVGEVVRVIRCRRCGNIYVVPDNIDESQLTCSCPREEVK